MFYLSAVATDVYSLFTEEPSPVTASNPPLLTVRNLKRRTEELAKLMIQDVWNAVYERFIEDVNQAAFRLHSIKAIGSLA
jgi:hypothetical protein